MSADWIDHVQLGNGSSFVPQLSNLRRTFTPVKGVKGNILKHNI